MPVNDDEAREFGQAFRDFLDWVHQGYVHNAEQSEVVRLVREHLGPGGLQQSVVVREIPPFDHANLQVALDAWSDQAGRQVTVRGVAIPPHHGQLSLHQLLNGDGLPPVRLSAPDLVDLAVGPDRTLACFKRAILLVEDTRGAYVILVRGPDPREDHTLSIEIAGLPISDAQTVVRELADLRAEHNVYRGQLLEVVASEMGATIAFPSLPVTKRADVVLPEQVLRRVERHTLDIAARRESLRDAGQHLKRGLLLYGPPGTGKTHTTRYLVQALEGSTIFLLSGNSLRFIAMVTQLARDLQPAVVVLEDVDLVAEDRGHGRGSKSILFELLDAMDGAAADADLLFLLTTNRADLLEPALAARPGRVDVAVEIGLPDADARRRLFEVYSRGVPLELETSDVDQVVARTEGVTASFIKELLRRAVLEALAETDGDLQEVTGTQLSRALDDLLDSTQSVTRALLGVPADQSGPVEMPSPGGEMYGGHGGIRWAMAQPGIVSSSTAYGSEATFVSD